MLGFAMDKRWPGADVDHYRHGSLTQNSRAARRRLAVGELATRGLRPPRQYDGYLLFLLPFK